MRNPPWVPHLPGQGLRPLHPMLRKDAGCALLEGGRELAGKSLLREAGRSAPSIVNATATAPRTSWSLRDDTIETGRRLRLAILAQNARRDALSADPLHVDNARLGGGRRYSFGPRRSYPGARLPWRGRTRRRGDDRLDVSDQAARKAVLRAFHYPARSRARVSGRDARGLRRRMAHQTDVPLPMEI